MSTHITNNFYGTIGQHVDHIDHQILHIDKDGNIRIEQIGNQSSLLSQSDATSAHPVAADEPDYCTYIDARVLDEKKEFSRATFQRMLAKAAAGNAKELALFLKKYERVGYLDFKGHTKKRIFEELNLHFPDTITYKLNNFLMYY